MSPEKQEITKDQRTALVDKILSSPSHLDAFIALEQIKRAQAARFEAAMRLTHECNLVGGAGGYTQDHELNIAIANDKDAQEQLNRLRDLVGQQRAVDGKFGKAYLDIEQVLEQKVGVKSATEVSSNFGFAIAVLDDLRKDYRIPLMEFALNLKKNQQANEVFQLYAKLSEAYSEDEWSKANGSPTNDDWLSSIQEELKSKNDDGFELSLYYIEQEIKDITELSGAQGPFAEQFIIESIENILDPQLKKERDKKAGRVTVYKT